MAHQPCLYGAWRFILTNNFPASGSLTTLAGINGTREFDLNSALATARVPELRQRVVEFVSAASTEIAPHDESLVPTLAVVLPVGAVVYVAHTPKSTLNDVVRVSIDLQRRGLTASPHIVARRFDSEKMLGEVFGRLRAAGINRILVIAGDRETPTGPFASALDIIDSGALTEAGFLSVGFAGHPEGHPVADHVALREALRRKQEFAVRSGMAVHLVTQFGFDAHTIVSWAQALRASGILLPVHVGLAGPTSPAKLLRFAIQCGVRTSLQAALKNPGSMGSLVGMKAAPGEMIPALVRLGAGEEWSQIVRPHFFTFGGALTGAQWIRMVAAGEFEMLRDGSLQIHQHAAPPGI